MSDDLIRRADELAASLARRPGTPAAFKQAISDLRTDLTYFRGRPIAEGLHELDRRITLPGRPERVPQTVGANAYVTASDGASDNRVTTGAWPAP